MAAIHISKPGKVKSLEGVSVDITSAMLREVAESYDPALHEAPMVIGHPTHDALAYGWVKGLSFSDASDLVADGEQSAELAELRDKGRLKKVSASYYTPDAPGNPKPGKWYLRHLGFLGAMPPAVKGLRTASFADGEEGIVTFGELPGYAGSYIASMLGRLRDWLIAKDGLETANQVMPAYEIESLRSMSQRADEFQTNPGGTPAFSFAEPGNAATSSKPAPVANPQEKPPMKTAEQLQAELDTSNAALANLRAAEQTRLAGERTAAAATRHTGHVSFAEGLVAAAKWPAEAKDVLVAALDTLATPGADAGVVSFGEGDAAKPLTAVLQEQLLALPASVSFAEFATGGGTGAQSPGQIAAKAITYQEEQAAKGRRVNTAEAVAHVSA